MRLILLLLSIALATLSCCVSSTSIVMHPMSPEHIFRIEQGARILQNDSMDVASVDGYFLSDKYLREVMEVKVERN